MTEPTTAPSPPYDLYEGQEEEEHHQQQQQQQQERHREQENTLCPPPQSWFLKEENEEEKNENTNAHRGAVASDEKSCQHLKIHTSTCSANQTNSQHRAYEDNHSVNNSDSCQMEHQHQHRHLSMSMASVGAPRKAPSWREVSSQVIPAAAKELLSSSIHRILYTARVSYSMGRWHRRYSDIGNPLAGYHRSDISLPPFSTLPWVDRQLVREWRTISSSEQYSGLKGDDDDDEEEEEEGDDDDLHFNQARTLVPRPLARPRWQKSDYCQECQTPFGPTRLRHHCRLCGKSFCQSHSDQTHKLPHLGYDPNVPERVCLGCKEILNGQSVAERIAWRLARCRDFFDGCLSPYFETGVDTVEDVALRVTNAAISMARAIPLGAQAHVAVETVEVLRKYGLKGIYGLIFRKEFLAAADLLCRALGINKTSWPLSVHELSAAIFYALAQHRAMRGMNPEREHVIHALRKQETEELTLGLDKLDESTFSNCHLLPRVDESCDDTLDVSVIDETDCYNPMEESVLDFLSLPDDSMGDTHKRDTQEPSVAPVCDPVPNKALSTVLFYAPLALNFVYAKREVDMQLLAAQQGWRLLYCHLDQENVVDRPGSALFVHEQHKIACFAIRGTATINDVITDIRQMPVSFPEVEEPTEGTPEGWTPIFSGHGLAVSGMARAATTLFHEHSHVLLLLARKGYRIRVTGHSLGGGVATLLGALILRQKDFVEVMKGWPIQSHPLRVFGFGTPACVDATLSDQVRPFVTTVVLHDDVVPRLTPTSIRGLLKHLLHIRETWVKAHLANDLMAITERAKTVWAPRWRSGFTLGGQSSLKKYCKKQIHQGTKSLLSVRGRLMNMASQSQEETWQSEDAEFSTTDSTAFESTDENPSNQPVVEFIGALDRSQTGIPFVVDGDEFYDPEESLLEEDSASTSGALSGESSVSDGRYDDAGRAAKTELEADCTLGSSSKGFEETEEEANTAVMLEETPLPRMYIPGMIMHVYTHRGAFKAVYVPRTFRELRRISLAGNMLSDHTCKAYYEGLLEVQTVRNAGEELPQWTPFDEDHTCTCCASRFTWASTSDTEAQEARDKHNCRSCGTLVCDPCSQHRVPLPSVGLTVSVRVCDRCYNDISGLLTGGLGLTDEIGDSLPDDLSTICEAGSHDSTKGDKRERRRARRSLVVDELASRIQSTVAVK